MGGIIELGKVIMPTAPRCTGEIALSIADAATAQVSLLVDLMLISGDEHDIDIAEVLEGADAVLAFLESIKAFITDMEPNQLCPQCTEFPGQ
jgi:hypothetical protein